MRTAPADRLDFDLRANTSRQRWRSIAGDTIALSTPPFESCNSSNTVAVHAKSSGYAAVALLAPRLTGRFFELRAFLPASSSIEWIQPFVLQDASGDWRWTGNWLPASELNRDAWNELAVPISSDCAAYWACGLEFHLSRPSYTALYIQAGI